MKLCFGLLLCVTTLSGCAQDGVQHGEAAPATAVVRDGVNVGEASSFRNLVPAEQVEQQASMQYQQLLRQAESKKQLVPADYPDVVRLRSIARRIIPFSYRFNERAKAWRWEVNLLASKQINAFCMPGGKIAFYTGLLQELKLTDDEVAIVMGHEIAHALREHARERMAKNGLTAIGTSVLGLLIGGGRYADVFSQGGELLTLKFSRDDESEADLVGLELSARAGFDPRAGITLWQKMAAASKGAPLAWFSTHPPSDDRIEEIRRHLPDVMPLYERAKSNEQGGLQRTEPNVDSSAEKDSDKTSSKRRSKRN